MIIDFHTHMFPDKIAKGTLDFLESVCKTHPYTDGTSEGLKASTEEAGIDISHPSTGSHPDSRREGSFLLEGSIRRRRIIKNSYERSKRWG